MKIVVKLTRGNFCQIFVGWKCSVLVFDSIRRFVRWYKTVQMVRCGDQVLWRVTVNSVTMLGASAKFLALLQERKAVPCEFTVHLNHFNTLDIW